MEHVLYINLSHRKDRKEHIERQLTNWGVPFERLDASAHRLGYLGCAQSHIRCLERAIEEKWPHVCIVEDDMYILDLPAFKQSLHHFLKANLQWDVLLLGGNVGPPYMKEKGCRRVINAQTTTAYVVQQHYYETLLKNFKQGLEVSKMMDEPEYRIDIFWKRLQRKDTWYILDPLTVVQIGGYSDIERRDTNYMSMMMSYKE
jgi:glycosyl transferase family 25